MSENLPVNSSGNLPVPGKAAEITVSGGNNSFVAHADTVENNITVMLNDPRSRRGENRARITFNTDFYHLFVILGEKFEDNYFLVPKDRALTESTNDPARGRRLWNTRREECRNLSPRCICRRRIWQGPRCCRFQYQY